MEEIIASPVNLGTAIINLKFDDIKELGECFTPLLDTKEQIKNSLETAKEVADNVNEVYKGGKELYNAVSWKIAASKGITGKLSYVWKNVTKKSRADIFSMLGKKNSTVPMTPEMAMLVLMAAVLISMESKMNQIQETQKMILNFLEKEKEANLKGNINILADILNNYKYNWNNEKYKTNKHIQVQEIKRDAEKDIIFYKESIESKISDKNFLNVSNVKEKKFIDIRRKFRYYQLAVYMYAYAAFLEAFLLENFDEEYLENVAQTMEEHQIKYRELYTECYNRLEKHLQKSIEFKSKINVAKVVDATGRGIAKIPIINKTFIDENLIFAAEKMGNQKYSKEEEILKAFRTNKKIDVRLFAENIRNAEKLFNNSYEVTYTDTGILLEG